MSEGVIAPAGTVPASAGTSQPAQSQPAQASTPSIVELRDDSLIKYGDMKEPVKYGDHFKGIQSQLTKKAQEAAERTRELAATRQALQERDNALRQYQQQQQQGQQTNRNQVLEAIRALPYLSGQEAARVVEHLQGQFNEFGNTIQQRDNALLMLAQHIQRQQQQLQSLMERSGTSDFDGKIGRWVKELDLPEDAVDFAKEMYLAYEGADLDDEFPNMLKSRWDKLQSAFRAADKRRLETQKSKPFVPGKGGQGSVSKPLKTGNMSAREIADSLWPMVNESQE